MRKYRFPSGFLVYASALYLFTPDQPLSHLSHSPVFYHSLAPFMSLSISLSPPLTLSLSIPAVAKAIVFCGGSWLGLICQAADLPSLVLTPFACTLFYFFLLFGIQKTLKSLIVILVYPKQSCSTSGNGIFQSGPVPSLCLWVSI